MLILKPENMIKTRLGLQPNGAVVLEATKICADHMDKYVPYASGDLAYKTRKIEPGRVIYDSLYAHYMYEGKVMGPNIPIKENGLIVRWVSPKGKFKHYTGKEINYILSQARGHKYAGPHWDQRMWSAEKKDVINELQRYINRGGNNASK